MERNLCSDEFLIAGASAVQIGTFNFVHPQITIDVIRGIQAHMEKSRIQCLSELLGTLVT